MSYSFYVSVRDFIEVLIRTIRNRYFDRSQSENELDTDDCLIELRQCFASITSAVENSRLFNDETRKFNPILEDNFYRAFHLTTGLNSIREYYYRFEHGRNSRFMFKELKNGITNDPTKEVRLTFLDVLNIVINNYLSLILVNKDNYRRHLVFPGREGDRNRNFIRVTIVNADCGPGLLIAVTFFSKGLPEQLTSSENAGLVVGNEIRTLQDVYFVRGKVAQTYVICEKEIGFQMSLWDLRDKLTISKLNDMRTRSFNGSLRMKTLNNGRTVSVDDIIKDFDELNIQ